MKENMVELAEEMTRVMAELRTKAIGEARAHEITNAAGKTINAYKTMLEYEKLKTQVKGLNIPFLNQPKKKTARR